MSSLTVLFPLETGKSYSLTKKSDSVLSYATQHNITSTVHSEEEEEEEETKIPQEEKGDPGFKKIYLTRGMVALVDDEDYDRISSVKWSAQKNCNTFYAKRNTPAVDGKRQGIELMHRWIITPPEGMEIDHINGDGLDNRKKNLRVVTHRQNSQNRHQFKTSQYPGVYWHTKDQRWRTQIRVQGKIKYLGSFPTEDAAYCKYCEAVRALPGGA